MIARVSEALATYPSATPVTDLFLALGISKPPTGLPSMAELARLAPSELTRMFGKRNGIKVAAAFEMGRRAQYVRTRPLRLSTPKEVFEYMKPRLCHLSYEVFHVLLLDTRHRLIADRRVAQGGLATCAIHPRDVFDPVIREAAPAMIFVHNHPSGDSTPSSDDLELTRRLGAAAALLGISLLDHVIVADGGFTSLAELGSLTA